jgi:hypothetical protein
LCQIIFIIFLWYLVRVETPPDKLPEKSKNGKVAFTREIEEKCLAACSSGFTLEKCAGLVGVPVGTIKTWVHRNPAFGRKMETARKNHELKLLRDIELAGEKSWQAKAWMAERVYSYAQPSARLQVSGGVEHTAGGSFAALLAGLASRRAEKKAQVIESQEVKQIEDVKGKYNSYCPTNKSQTIVTPTPKNSGKPRPLRMRRRKPRAESLKKWPVHDTPPTTPPATDSHA